MWPSLLPYKPCKYVSHGMVFVSFRSEKGYRLCPFWLAIEHGFRGRYERIRRFNSKRVICEFEMGVFWRSNLTRNDDVIFGYVGLNTGTDFRAREGHVFRKARKLFGPKEKFKI